MPSRPPFPTVEHRECVVVGAGIVGLSAARSLSRRGADVLVLDAAEPGHALSGSKGTARIFRLSYPDPFYVRLALAAHDHWRALESESGSALLQLTGQLSFGADLGTLATSMEEGGAPFEALSAAETRHRFPQVHPDGHSLYEECSGVLAADACLRALTDTARFELRRCEVAGIEDGAGAATVVLAGSARIRADVVLNCAGHRARSIMHGTALPVMAAPSLQQVIYLAPTEPGPAAPVFIEWGEGMIYGLPVPGSDLFKLSHHSPGPAVDTVSHPLGDDAGLVALLGRAAARLLPAYSADPVATERCVYDNTEDGDFVIERVGHIVVGCGTSGHGFKFGPLLGELLADLALGTEPSFDLHRFSSRRSPAGLLPDPSAA